MLVCRLKTVVLHFINAVQNRHSDIVKYVTEANADVNFAD